MEFFDFIKPGELDNLPEDPQLAFAQFVRLAQPRLVERLEALDDSQQGDWHLIQEARYGFQNVVLGAAKKFRIAPFSSHDLPLVENYNENDYRQFRADLSHYITQIMLVAADQERNTSIPLIDRTRQSLATYIFHLREAIRNSELPDGKKARLNQKLDELEQELNRRRIRMAVVAGIVMSILAAPGELGGSYDAVVRLTSTILRELGQAKAADNEQREISADKPIALAAPRKPVAKHRPAPAQFERAELDDEIPF